MNMEKFTVLIYLSTVMVLFKHVIDAAFTVGRTCGWNLKKPITNDQFIDALKAFMELIFSVALFIFLTDYLFY